MEMILRKDVEIGFLIGIIQEFTSGSINLEDSENSPMKSNVFELLGQSMIDPKRSE